MLLLNKCFRYVILLTKCPQCWNKCYGNNLTFSFLALVNILTDSQFMKDLTVWGQAGLYQEKKLMTHIFMSNKIIMALQE